MVVEEGARGRGTVSTAPTNLGSDVATQIYDSLIVAPFPA